MKNHMTPVSEDKVFFASLLEEFVPDRNAKVLICGGGAGDLEVVKALNYRNVLITGMDLRENKYGKETPTFENAESLSFSDEVFDYAVMQAAIHHTSLPHKVLTELYRVAKTGVLVVEARDSILMRIAERIGLTERYEVAGNFSGHGVNGTDIPNHIYRWTEREIEKTIMSYAPQANHRFIYRYSSNYPNGHGFSPLGKITVTVLKPFFRLFVLAFPRQQNIMGFFIKKPSIPGDLKPWLLYDSKEKEIKVNREWIRSSYRKRLSR